MNCPDDLDDVCAHGIPCCWTWRYSRAQTCTIFLLRCRLPRSEVCR